MKKIILYILFNILSIQAYAADKTWYVGDEKCIPPQLNDTYSAPYKALDHQNDYPTFPDANKSGWSCSYQKNDGTIIQYGDSRTPQEQWLAIWGRSDD